MDRAEAIKRCDRYNEEWANARANDVEPFIVYNQNLDDLFYMAGKALREQEQSQWISVKERLPEESGQYIVCCDDSGCPYGEGIWYESGVVVCAQVDVGINGGVCWEWNENGTLYDLEGVVTHWMPLPEPPEEEANE